MEVDINPPPFFELCFHMQLYSYEANKKMSWNVR